VSLSNETPQEASAAAAAAAGAGSVPLLARRTNGGGIGGAPSASVRSLSFGTGLFARPLMFNMGGSLHPSAASAASAADEPLSLDQTTAHSLRLLRARLQTRQDSVYEGETRSHDEMAAQDAEWNELDSQIHAIESLLSAFRVIYRQR
jgi:hypothetical protein